MNILIAPDSFKESLSAVQVTEIIANTLQKYGFNTRKLPVADGGEGTTESLVKGLGGNFYMVDVNDPLNRKTTATYGIVKKNSTTTAIVEMAESSGLMLLTAAERNPLIASTYGLGEMIVHALDMGANDILIGIGGSATNDGGIGMLQALGVKFLDIRHNEIADLPHRMGDIAHINTTHIDTRLKNIPIQVACDVNNPLLGTNGATAIYGRQKGVTPETHILLEQGLTNYADIAEKHVNQEVRNTPGAGAAGGLGFALMAFLGAKLTSGIDLILQTVDFNTHAQWADIVITGEGKIDSQTINGKTPAGVAKTANALNTPTLVVAGVVDKGWESLRNIGVKNAYAITPPHMDLATALRTAPKNLQNTVENIAYDLQKISD